MSRERLSLLVYSDMSSRRMAPLIVEEVLGQRFGDLRLAHAGGAGQQEGADRPVPHHQTSLVALDGLRETAQGRPLGHHLALEGGAQGEGFLSVVGHRDAGVALDDARQALVIEDGFFRRLGVDHCVAQQGHRLVGLPPFQIAGREVVGAHERPFRHFDLRSLGERFRDLTQDPEGLGAVHLRDDDLFEAAGERGIGLDQPGFLEGRRADHPQGAVGEGRFQGVGRWVALARMSPGPHQVVHLVDEQDDLGVAGDLMIA